MSRGSYFLIGLDLGVYSVAAGLTDTECRLLRTETVVLPRPQEVAAVLDLLSDVARRLVADLPGSAILGVGVACAGLIDREEGKVVMSPNLAWREVPLRAELARRLPWEVFVGNDVNLAALGEWQQGAGIGTSSMLAVFVGTGIGAGLILDGRLYEGAHGFAGEIGHVRLGLESGATDRAGVENSLEGIASGPALSERAVAAWLAGEPTTLAPGPDGQIAPEAIGQAELLGDPLARRLVGEASAALGLAIANAVTLFDPERVVLGGALLRAIPSLVNHVRSVIQRHTMSDLACLQDVAAAQLGAQAPVIGAASLARMAGKLAGRSP